MINLLIFSIVKTQPNITFAIAIIAWFAKNPSYTHIKAVITISYYLNRLINCSIIYNRKKKLFIKRYLDSDWADNKENQKLISGFIFMLNGDPVR